MDCSGANADTFGCWMNNIAGSWFAGFLNTAGNPATTVIFIILIVAFLVILFIAAKNVIS